MPNEPPLPPFFQINEYFDDDYDDQPDLTLHTLEDNDTGSNLSGECVTPAGTEIFPVDFPPEEPATQPAVCTTGQQDPTARVGHFKSLQDELMQAEQEECSLQLHHEDNSVVGQNQVYKPKSSSGLSSSIENLKEDRIEW